MAPAGADGQLRTPDDSLALTARSPALDAGRNAALDTTGNNTRDITTDITGRTDSRVKDFDGDETATVNMGAYETAHPTAPEPFTGPVASATGAALRGAVNPWDGSNTQARFRVYPTGSPDQDTMVAARTLSGNETLQVDPTLTVSDITARPVRATVRQLAPNTEYEAELVATNDEGIETSAPVTFQTPRAPKLQAGDGNQTFTARLTAGSGFEKDSTVFARTGGSGQYREFPKLSASAFEPGKAFWLVTKRGAPLGLKSGTTVNASTPQVVRLKPGWNQLGNPFGISVPWSAVRDTSGLGSAVGDPLTYRDGEYQQSTALAPWQGYFVFNAASEPDTLLIPPVEAGGSNLQSATGLAAGPGATAKTGGGYTLQISARGTGSTSRAVLDLRAGSKAGRDTMDIAQPPPVEPSVRLSAVEKVGNRGTVPHAESVKPTGGNGQAWPLRLRRPARGDTPSKVRLDWSESGTPPAGQGRYVLDLSTEQRVTPGKTVSLQKGETRRLKVIVGTERYAEKNSEGVSLKSYENELRGNYPNPFDEQTTLEYTLREERPVTIEIYNVLGQRVRTLVDAKKTAGLHRARWDGTNRYGDRVGSGVYFHRIEAGSFTASKKMVLVR